MTRSVCIGVALAVLLAAIGCGPADECAAGQSRCGASGPEYCRHECGDMGCSNYRWTAGNGCKAGFQTCIQPAGLSPFCAEGAAKDQRCNDAATSSYCEGNDLVKCAAGYRVQSAPCDSPAAPSSAAPRCMPDALQGAVCVLPDAVVNPVCGDTIGDEGGRHCQGSTLVQCMASYEISRMLCQTCSVTERKCTGFLGDACSTDTYCASGLNCQQGRCTVACTVEASLAADAGNAADAGDDARGDASEADAAAAPAENGGACKAAFSGSGPFHPDSLGFGFDNYVLKCVAGLCVWD
jgi:hypothetical protein